MKRKVENEGYLSGPMPPQVLEKLGPLARHPVLPQWQPQVNASWLSVKGGAQFLVLFAEPANEGRINFINLWLKFCATLLLQVICYSDWVLAFYRPHSRAWLASSTFTPRPLEQWSP